MKFETNRTLKNKVFSTSLVRVSTQDDPCLETEKQLEDDFGSVQVDAGGKFEVYVTKTANAKPTFSNTATTDTKTTGEFLFKFALDTKVVALVPKVELSYSCDAKQESPRKDGNGLVIPVLEVAELKCEIFEALMRERISKAVASWKEQQTDFETVEIPSFEECLS